MTLLPIVVRELRVSARRRSTYRVRTYAALVVMLGGAWFFMVMQRAAPRELAENLFAILTGCAVLFGLASGCFTTANCIADEKREGTLGLLFLTDLRGYDVVLGKLAANSLNAFYTMTAVVPLLAVPLMLGGGLTAGDFVRMALVAIDALFFSLAAGVFVSSLCRSNSQAAGLTFLLILFFTALWPLIGVLVTWRLQPPGRQLPSVYVVSSAFYAYALALDQQYRVWAARFWVSLGVIHGLGWLFLGLASLITPRVWQDRPARDGMGWRERWRQRWGGSWVKRAEARRRYLDINAFFWLAARVRLKPWLVWSGLVLIAGAWIWGYAEYRRDWLDEPAYYIATAFCAHLFLRMRFAGEAPWQLVEERKAGTLELLLCTPMTVPELIHGQRLAMQRQFLWPVVLVLGLDILALLAPNWVPGWRNWGIPTTTAWTAVWGGAIVLLVADLWTLFWVGMWQGLTAKTALRATSNSLGNVFMIPCVIYALFLLYMVLGFSRRPIPVGREPGPWLFFYAWFIPRLVVDAASGWYAREKLLSQFRAAAQLGRDPQPGLWGRWLGTELCGF